MLGIASSASAAGEPAAPTRYSLANGCWALKSNATGGFVARSGTSFVANAGAVSAAEPFTLQATDLGKYLLYGKPGDFLAASGASGVGPAGAPSAAADFTVTPAGGGFKLKLDSTGRFLVAGDGGTLATGGDGDAAVFTFAPASGCTKYPEVSVSATGEPLKGNPYGEVAGLVDAHIHMMAFEFLGGGAHCGRPWHPYGVTEALQDCPDHYTGVSVLEPVLGGEPTHDPVGWPTFKYWPNPHSLTHEQTYWKWLERAWMGGLRTYVNLMVDNRALCELYPIKKHGCNEMETVRLQIADIYKLQDYIDAQYGGPGKGFFRIVTDPFQARKIVADGKLAVVLGIETSELFGCGIRNDVPQCTKEQIDQQLDEVYRMGIRDLELVNKFDNAFTGVAGDAGSTGVITNVGNFYITGSFFQLQTCSNPNATDREAITTTGRDQLIGNGLQALLPPGLTPVYPPGPHCNKKGLTALGEHLVRRMMQKGMLIDPDHMSVLGRDHLLALAEAANYSGVVSSHSWSSEDAYPRIYNLGGFVAPYAGDSTSFVKEWQKRKKAKNARYYFGFGYGADMNGFGAQGDPRGAEVPNPVKYPFKSFDGGVTFQKQKSGEREYDINVDGVAHYGLYPDWVEDLRQIGGDEIITDMARGSEAYLQTWERAVGVPRSRCAASRARFYSNGLLGRRLKADWTTMLRRVGQPGARHGVKWEWCVNGEANGKSRVATVVNDSGKLGLIASNARYHRYRNVGAGQSSRKLPRGLKKYGSGVYVTSLRKGARFVFGVRGGKVTFVAVATKEMSSTRAVLRKQLKLTGLL